MRKLGCRFYAMLLCSSFVLGGCNFIPEPVTLLQPPQYIGSAGELEKTVLQKSKELLPAGTFFTTANQPAGSESIVQADFNGDGTNEVVFLYQSIVNQEQIGALILKNDNGEWKKAGELKGTGYEVSWASSADVTGDGKLELLLGWKIGASAGNVLDIFTWGESGLEKLTQLNYHELEVLFPEDKKDTQARIAVWNRDMADVYKTEIVKWENDAFQPDFDYYPAYFSKVADYYDERALLVPNASYYWYYLADARLKEGNPELALQAVQRGMNLKTAVPSFSEFEKLQSKIEKSIALEKRKMISFYQKEADLSLDVPREFASNVMILGKEGMNNEFIVQVSADLGNGQPALLFTVEVYPKDWINSVEDYGLSPLFQTEKLAYGLRKEAMDDPQMNKLADEMISSIRHGTFYPVLISQEEKLLLKQIKTAVKNYWYVTSGGKMDEGLIESFTLNDMDYRYMGSDLDTKEKLVEFLSSTYSTEVIQQYIERSGIVEHNGKLAQPNADGGSIADYERARIILTKDIGSEREYDVKVPIGDSLITQTVHIVLRKTDSGWRIDSLPGSF